MKLWLFPINFKFYNIKAVVNNEEEIYWPARVNLDLDDIVYVYVAAPFSEIMYKMKVIEKQPKLEKVMQQIENYANEKPNINKYPKIYTLKLIKTFKSKEITIKNLKENGLNMSLMAPRCISKIPQLNEFFLKYEKKQ